MRIQVKNEDYWGDLVFSDEIDEAEEICKIELKFNARRLKNALKPKVKGPAILKAQDHSGAAQRTIMEFDHPDELEVETDIPEILYMDAWREYEKNTKQKSDDSLLYQNQEYVKVDESASEEDSHTQFPFYLESELDYNSSQLPQIGGFDRWYIDHLANSDEKIDFSDSDNDDELHQIAQIWNVRRKNGRNLTHEYNTTHHGYASNRDKYNFKVRLWSQILEPETKREEWQVEDLVKRCEW